MLINMRVGFSAVEDGPVFVRSEGEPAAVSVNLHPVRAQCGNSLQGKKKKWGKGC